ncbi:MAG: TIM44-like domain-containing protein [Betaproteobacteria bacterium]
MLKRLRRRVIAARTAAKAWRRSRRVRRMKGVPEFLQVARQSFLELQAAWDRADWRALQQLATEPLLADLREQYALRGPGPNRTEVLELHAELLALEDLREAFVASVEFRGLIRESGDAAAAPFRELWLLANVKSADRGWRLARVQALA